MYCRSGRALIMNLARVSKIDKLAAAIAIALAITPVAAVDRVDTDRDGVSDSSEISFGLDPNNPDTDGAGANDGWELKNFTNPLDPSDDSQLPIDWDVDNDGIDNAHEGSNHYDLDSDEDGLPDSIEGGFIDDNRDGFIDTVIDNDNDGWADVALAVAIAGYPNFDNDAYPDHLDTDADNDGVPDYNEYHPSILPADFPYDPWDVDGDGQLNGLDLDADGDGKLDIDEYDLSIRVWISTWTTMVFPIILTQMIRNRC